MRNTIMKTTITIPALTVLLVTASSQCFAVVSIAEVSPERAEELGMEVRSNAAGPDAVRVELEFKAEGELEDYIRVDLAIHQEGKLLMSATLREEESSEGRVIVGFAADRANLDKMTLRVVTGAPRNLVGYDLQVQDFVDLQTLR